MPLTAARLVTEEVAIIEMDLVPGGVLTDIKENNVFHVRIS